MQRFWVRSALLISIVFAGTQSRAVDRPERWVGLTVGYQTGYVKYDEPGLMKEYGDMQGIVAAFTFPIRENMAIRGEYEYAGGHLTYDGATQAGTPVKTTTTDRVDSQRVLFVWQPDWVDWLAIDPFAGLARRYLNDRIHGSGGYEREITYIYAPVGVNLSYPLGNGLSVGLGHEIDLFLGGTVKSHLSDVSSTLPDVTNRQDSGIGFRLSVNLQYTVSKFSVMVQPFLHYWDIDDSDIVRLDATTGLLEPKNTSRWTGVNIIADF